MVTTSPGKVLLSKIIPPKYNDNTTLDTGGIKNLFTRMAKEMPREEYSAVLKRLNTFGNNVATEYGGVASIHLSDLHIPPELQELREGLKRKIRNISQSPIIPSKEKNKMIVDLIRNATPDIDNAVLEALGNKDNSFGLLVKTGIRGKKAQLRQLVFGDLLTLDSKNRDIPYPTLRSYGEGITPLQYWTASHGGRQGYYLVQKATADAGYFSKQIRGTVHKQVVTSHDCGKATPLYVDSDSSNNIGSLLYTDTKGKSGKVYKANTPITEDMLDDLPNKVGIRSAVSCGQGDGVCAMCAGIRESGKLSDIGDPVGLNGVNSFLEALTQSGLCLYENTEVRMADNSIRAIKDINRGDTVIASDINGNTFPTRVVALHNNGVRTVYKFGLLGRATSVCCTMDHKFLSKDGIIGSIDRVNDFLILDNGEKKEGFISSIEYFGEVQTYDIEIDTDDHLFVLANGLITSNSSKHSGGESSMTRRMKRGLEAVDQFVNMPENFVGGATIADEDGVVGDTKEAPQGGKFLRVGNIDYHIPADAEIKVKRGDRIEAGDVLTDGMPDMSKIVQHKGIGEGRKEFMNNLYDLLKDNGAGTMRKNIETFARGFVNRVEVTDPDGVCGWIYGDIADYDSLASKYKPREGSEERDPRTAYNSYLEKPALHYSIGTRITPRVANDLYSNGVSKVVVNKKEPQFVPYMTSAKQTQPNDEDWITSLSGENLQKSLLQHVNRGSDSYKNSVSIYPRLALVSGQYPKPLTIK